MANNIWANVVASEPDMLAFPEQTPEFMAATTNCGICFSGGGTRALASTAGQMRALSELHLLANARYISCVSGGSWAAGAYTFYCAGAEDDEEFLGPHPKRSERKTWSLQQWAQSLQDCNLVTRATVGFADKVLQYAEEGHEHMAWIYAVRDSYYQPFGLGDQRYVAGSEAAVDAIIDNNPTLTKDQFHIPRKGRPFLIINGTLEWPARLFSDVWRVLVQFTPAYVGNPKALRLVEKWFVFWKCKLWTGGGFVDSFAFGSRGPNAAPGPWVEMPKPREPFSIWHASGISSAAYGYEAAKLDAKFVIPKMEYWSIKYSTTSWKNAAAQYFTDGGNLENFGIMAMLQRKVKNLIVFVDSETVLPATPDKVMDHSDVTPLFGLKNSGMPHNQIFPEADYHSLLKGWVEAQAQGGLAMHEMTHVTLANSWFGIEAGCEVCILWVYAAAVTNWIKTLNPDVQEKVHEGIRGSEPLAHFPNYRTLDENRLATISLSKSQAALLADMYSWSIREQCDAFKRKLVKAERPDSKQ